MYYLIYETNTVGWYKAYEDYEEARKLFYRVTSDLDWLNREDGELLGNLNEDYFINWGNESFLYGEYVISYNIFYFKNFIIDYKDIHCQTEYVFYIIERKENFNPKNLRRENNGYFIERSKYFPRTIELIMN